MFINIIIKLTNHNGGSLRIISGIHPYCPALNNCQKEGPPSAADAEYK